MSRNWDISSDLEFQSIDAIAEFQNAALQEQIDYISTHSPYYRRVFESLAITPEDIRTVADLTQLPFTTKADLEEHNDDFLCVPRAQIQDLCQTSGTTGKPVMIMQTGEDLERLAYN